MVLEINEANVEIPLGSHYFSYWHWCVWMCCTPPGSWYSQNKNQIELCMVLTGEHLQVWVFLFKAILQELLKTFVRAAGAELKWSRGWGECQSYWAAAKWVRNSSGEMQMDVGMDRKLGRNYSLKLNLTFKCFALEKSGFGSEDGP